MLRRRFGHVGPLGRDAQARFGDQAAALGLAFSGKSFQRRLPGSPFNIIQHPRSTSFNIPIQHHSTSAFNIIQHLHSTSFNIHSTPIQLPFNIHSTSSILNYLYWKTHMMRFKTHFFQLEKERLFGEPFKNTFSNNFQQIRDVEWMLNGC